MYEFYLVLDKHLQNLHRISETNRISRRLASGDISAEDAYQALGKIRTSQSINHDLLFKFIAAAIIYSIGFRYSM